VPTIPPSYFNNEESKSDHHKNNEDNNSGSAKVYSLLPLIAVNNNFVQSIKELPLDSERYPYMKEGGDNTNNNDLEVVEKL
jgi:hypothetical protein